MMFRQLAVFSCFLLAAGALAQSDPIGTWVGKLYIVHPTDKKAKPVQLPAPQGNATYTLTIKAGGVYTTVITGTPDNKKHTADGTWKRSGANTTITVVKRDGKPDTSEPRTRILEMSKDGKTMTTEMKGSLQVRGPKGETKLPKGTVLPKVMLIFTRSK